MSCVCTRVSQRRLWRRSRGKRWGNCWRECVCNWHFPWTVNQWTNIVLLGRLFVHIRQSVGSFVSWSFDVNWKATWMNWIVDKAGVAAKERERGFEEWKRSHVAVHNMGQWRWWWGRGGVNGEATWKKLVIVIALLGGCALNQRGKDLVRRIERMVWMRWQPGRGVNWISVEILHMHRRGWLTDGQQTDKDAATSWDGWEMSDTQNMWE